MTVTMPTVTAFHPSGHFSPTSVLHHGPDHVVDTLILPGNFSTNNSRKVSQRNMEDGQGCKMQRDQDPWSCPASKKSKRTTNPIAPSVAQVTRRIRLGHQRRDGKHPISLASGDSTQGSDLLSPCPQAIEAVVKASLEKPHVAGYANACGTPEARNAIAKHHAYPEVRIGPDNVIVTNGCSGALDLALNTLLDADSTLLVPQPGFPLYEEIAKSIGANIVHYHLNPDKNWECDLEHLESIMSSCQSSKNVRAMVINNPSSPTGSVFSESHLIDIVQFAKKHRLPIVSDEIYGDITFEPNRFLPIAQIAARLGLQVPVVTASGISKQFLLGGWRVGWLCFHDNIHGSLREIQAGAVRLVQLQHGTSNLAQAAVPTLLDPTTPGMTVWKESLRLTLKRRAERLSKSLDSCPGLEVIAPQGAMYAIVKVDTDLLGFEHDTEFAMRLVDEENVFVLPGTSIGVQNVFRVAYTASEMIIEAATHRIESFCRRHAKTGIAQYTHDF